MTARPSIPTYRLHKPSGLAVVRLSGRDVYLGRHGTPESKRQYETAIAEWLANHRTPTPSVDRSPAPADFSVNELIIAFMAHARVYYIKNGRPTSEVASYCVALRPLAGMYGRTPVHQFGPRAMRAVREHMVAEGLSRGTVNAWINRIRRVFKWGVGEELVEPSVLHGLQALAPLRRGRCAARETEPIRPVDAEIVEATIAAASPPVAAMIRIQQLTGMRPGEVVAMRRCDLDRSKEVWVYTPAAHKTEHHGRQRTICLGPRAQLVLTPFLEGDPDACLFRPCDATAWHLEQRRVAPESRSNQRRARRSRPRNPKRSPGERYTTAAYAKAILYACDKAFPVPEGLSATEREAWRKQHRWAPNRLRHTAATVLRRRFGLDAARAVLGHSSPVVTEIYAELDQNQAAEVMAEIG